MLAAFAQWGAECQLRFNGMWAFAIWDRREQTLFLSRDGFGVKPLLHVHERNRFAFASELKAFLAELRSTADQLAWRYAASNRVAHRVEEPRR